MWLSAVREGKQTKKKPLPSLHVYCTKLLSCLVPVLYYMFPLIVPRTRTSRQIKKREIIIEQKIKNNTVQE